MSLVERLWSKLLEEKGSAPGWKARRLNPSAPAGILVAIRQPDGVPALLVEVEAQSLPPILEYPKSKGFEVYPEAIRPGPFGRVRVCLALSDTRYREVFGVLADDLVQKMSCGSSESDSVRILLARLHAWQGFVEKHGIEGLSLESQIGLVGELMFLERLLFHGFSAHDVVQSWNGPVGGVHDFNVGVHSVEVKGTISFPAELIYISNLAQLDDMGSNTLLLCHICMKADEPDGETLPAFISRLDRTITDESPSAASVLHQKLMEAGYIDDHADRYTIRRFRLRSLRFYRVSAGFPRIIPNDVQPGIADCSYAILVSACKSHEIEVAMGFDLLRGVQSD